MKKRIFLIFLLLGIFVFASSVFAQEKMIKLKDGVVLRGKVLSKTGDVYKIDSPMLGILSVHEADIVSIEEPVLVSTPVSTASGVVSFTEGVRQKIINDSRLMAAIQALTEDKEVLEILSDPGLKTAVLRQDLDYLKNNEKFLKFMNHPAVKKMVTEVTAPKQEGERQQ